MLHSAGLRAVLVQPMRARHSARAIHPEAKTDAIDAQVQAHMAKLAVDETPLWEPVEAVIADPGSPTWRAASTRSSHPARG